VTNFVTNLKIRALREAKNFKGKMAKIREFPLNKGKMATLGINNNIIT
jgi:hypothetical protein